MFQKVLYMWSELYSVRVHNEQLSQQDNKCGKKFTKQEQLFWERWLMWSELYMAKQPFQKNNKFDQNAIFLGRLFQKMY